ncbi:MAG: Ig-like domain-containing protein [Muribaculaceae bacterium]
MTIAPNEALSEVVYSSGDPSVAEIATDGTITVKSAGTTVITAAIPDGNTTYKPVSVSYTLTVTDPSNTYYLVKSLADFDPTQKCMLVAYKSGSYSAAMGAQGSGDYRGVVALNIQGAALPDQLSLPAGAVEFTLEKTAPTATTYYINVGSKYISYGGSSTKLTEVTSDPSAISLSFANDYKVSLTENKSTSKRILGYNNTTDPKRFAWYLSSNAEYTQVYLYQLRSAVEKEDADIDWDDIDTDAEVTRQLVGDCTFPTLSVMPDAAANSVRYTSSNEAVATIDPVSGEITRLAVGSTTITAKIEGDETYKNVYDTYKLTIVDDRAEVAIAFSPASATGYIRRADEFTWPAVSVKVNDAESEDARAAVVFSSSNDEVMSIGSDYTDHNFLSYGTANIIASIPADNVNYKPVTATCAITVLRDEVTLAFDKATAEAAVFAPFDEPQLTVTPDEHDVTAAVTYKSSAPDVASVDAATGEVTVYKTGTAVITASYAGDALFAPAADASYTLTVSDNRPTPSITWSCGAEMSYAMGAGEDFVSPTLTISGEGVVSDDVMVLLTFETSSEAVATVSAAGVVEVKGEGTAVISATVPNGDATYAPVTASFTLTVTNSNPDVYYLTANGETFADGDYIIIFAADKTNFVSKEYLSGNDRKVGSLSEAAGSTITPTDADNYMIFKVVAAEGGVRLLTTNYGGTNGYATCAAGATSFMIASTATDNYSLFNITYENGNDAVIKNVGNERWMRYNANKFRFYASNLDKGIYIYKKALAQKPDDPTFSQPDGTELTWQTAAVTVTSAHATKVYYRTKYYDADADEWQWAPDWTSVEGNYAVIYVHDPCNIEAYGENQYGKSETATASYTIYGAGATIYNYVNSLDRVDLDKKYILVNRDNKMAMGSYNKSGKYHSVVEIGVATDGTSATAQSALAFKLVSTSDPFGGGSTGDTDPTEPAAIKAREVAASDNTYYMLLDNGNYMKLNTSANETSEVATTAEATKFEVSFTDNLYVLLSDTESGRYLGCNFGSKRFSSYADNSYKSTYLFQEGDKLVTGVEDIAVESADEAADAAAVEWYTLQGVRVENPGAGFYIRRCGSKATKHLLK